MLILETYLSITTVSPATVNTASEFLFFKEMSSCSASAEDRSNAPIDFSFFLK
jgi:hypothetical protein